jgi:DNA primase
MRKRHKCPLHKESTPSAVVYDDRFWCFGCSKGGPIEQLGLSADELEEETERYVEDVKETYASYIHRLPLVEHRGLSFPTDSTGYFITWPNDSYYKYRKTGLNVSEGGKYRGPTGVKKPPLIIPKNLHSDTVVVVEGEINALSLDSIPHSYALISPGGCGDFYGRNLDSYFDWLVSYKHILAVLDADKAGIKAAIEFKSRLLTYGHTSNKLSLWEKDANDILTTEGKEALDAKIKKEMEVFGGV